LLTKKLQVVVLALFLSFSPRVSKAAGEWVEPGILLNDIICVGALSALAYYFGPGSSYRRFLNSRKHTRGSADQLLELVIELHKIVPKEREAILQMIDQTTDARQLEAELLWNIQYIGRANAEEFSLSEWFDSAGLDEPKAVWEKELVPAGWTAEAHIGSLSGFSRKAPPNADTYIDYKEKRVYLRMTPASRFVLVLRAVSLVYQIQAKKLFDENSYKIRCWLDAKLPTEHYFHIQLMKFRLWLAQNTKYPAVASIWQDFKGETPRRSLTLSAQQQLAIQYRTEIASVLAIMLNRQHADLYTFRNYRQLKQNYPTIRSTRWERVLYNVSGQPPNWLFATDALFEMGFIDLPEELAFILETTLEKIIAESE